MKDQNSIIKNLEKLIIKYHLEKELNVNMVIGWVTAENEPDAMKSSREYQAKWLKHLANIPDIDEANDFIEVFTDVWNYFPHKSLNGHSTIDIS